KLRLGMESCLAVFDDGTLRIRAGIVDEICLKRMSNRICSRKWPAGMRKIKQQRVTAAGHAVKPCPPFYHPIDRCRCLPHDLPMIRYAGLCREHLVLLERKPKRCPHVVAEAFRQAVQTIICF